MNSQAVQRMNYAMGQSNRSGALDFSRVWPRAFSTILLIEIYYIEMVNN